MCAAQLSCWLTAPIASPTKTVLQWTASHLALSPQRRKEGAGEAAIPIQLRDGVRPSAAARVPVFPETKCPPKAVRNLNDLIVCGFKFPTIYADPPWAYRNCSARGRAENHYRTLTVQQICTSLSQSLLLRTLICSSGRRALFFVTHFLSSTPGGLPTSRRLWLKPQISTGDYSGRLRTSFCFYGVRGVSLS